MGTITDCSWCGKEISRDNDKSDDGPKSHGICKDCDDKVREEAGLPKRKDKE